MNEEKEILVQWTNLQGYAESKGYKVTCTNDSDTPISLSRKNDYIICVRDMAEARRCLDACVRVTEKK